MSTETFEVTIDGCDRVLKALERYEKQLIPKLDEVCKRLAQIGADAANLHYAEARADSAETGNSGTTAIVLPLETGNGYKVFAQGQDVYFIEFGTGNAAGMFYGDGLPPTSVPVYPGSWSEQHSKMYSTNEYWFWHGEIMSSTPVYMPMYYAGKAIRENMKRVIEEVFSRK